jgi:ABC-2 type transport system permease protein
MTARILALVWLELRSAWRRPLWWVMLATLFLLTWGLASGGVQISAGGSSANAERAWLNSQFNLAFGDTLVFSLIYLFFLSVAFGGAIPDDEDHRIGSILHSTRLTMAEYVLGRFMAVASVASLVMALHLVFQMGFFQLYPVEEPDKVRGPFEAWNFIRPFLLFVWLPGLCLGAFTFAIGAISRQLLLVFLVPTLVLLVSIFFLWGWNPEWLSPGLNSLLCGVDITGFRWLNSTWLKDDLGAAFYNRTPVGLDGVFIANRAWMVAVAIGALATSVVHATRTLRKPFPMVGTESARIVDAADEQDRRTPVRLAVEEPRLAELGMRQAQPGWLDTLLAQAASEARELRRSPGLWIFVPLITLQVFGTAMQDPGPFNTPMLLTSGTLAQQSFNTVTLLSLLLILFYATESLARDDRTRIAPMLRCAPVRSGARLLGKFLANGVVVLLSLLVAVYAALVLAVLVQGIGGGSGTSTVNLWIAPDPMPLVKAWGMLLLPTVAVWMGMIALVWSVTRNRYAVYGAGLGVLIATGLLYVQGWVNWMGNWHLWDGMVWSDFGSFELDRTALVLNRLAWLSTAALLMVLALMADRRRTPDASGVVSRLRPRHVMRGVLCTLPAAVPAVVFFTALGLEIRAGGEGGPAQRAAKLYRASNAETWRNVPQPAIDEMDVDVRIDPREGTFAMKGRYVLRNIHEKPIDALALTPGFHYRNLSWEFAGRTHDEASAAADRKATRGLIAVENSAGLWVFRPEKPLARGETATVSFSYDGRWPDGVGRNSRGASEFILPAGVVLNSFSASMLPLVGWVDGVGVDPEDAVEPRRPRPDEWRECTKAGFGNGGTMTVRARVTVPDGYRAHCPGVLERDTVQDGWRTMEWRTDQPVRFFNVVAGDWQETRGERTSIWHLASHPYNIESMKEALDASHRWYSEWFYPYPWKELRLTEFPGLATYAQGFGTNIVFSEGIGFLAKPTETEDAPFLITAHEAAHQWWGNILMPGDGPGGNILSEGLAHYSTARLFEKVRGAESRKAFLRGIEQTYCERRRADEERPMVQVDGMRPGDTTVTYDKGGWVFWMLKDLMGEEACDRGTRAFIERFKDGPDYPLLQDYTVVMREFAPDQAAFDAFVAQWFHDVVLPEFEVTGATCVQEGDEWLTTLSVRNKGTGTVDVEVAVTNGAERKESPQAPDAAATGGAPTSAATDGAASAAVDAQEGAPTFEERRARLQPAPGGDPATVTLRTPWQPKDVVVDPDVRVLQLKRKQAVGTVKEAE